MAKILLILGACIYVSGIYLFALSTVLLMQGQYKAYAPYLGWGIVMLMVIGILNYFLDE